jgi:CRISPR-associated endonuclease/helicase Cas3
VRDLVSALPPTSSESVALPLPAVRHWLTDREVVPVADVDGAPEPEDASRRTCKPVLKWRGDESTIPESPSDIGAGDVLIVPSSYGGYARGGWDPTCDDVVADLAHEAQLRDRGTVVLRLQRQFWTITPPTPALGEDESMDSPIAEWLDAIAETAMAPILVRAVEWLREGDSGPRRRYDLRRPSPGADALNLVGRRPLPSQLRTADLVVGETVDSEPDTSSFTAREVSLDNHLCGVGALAGSLARAVGLSRELAGDIELAGRLHDLGKSDERFQFMLHRGDPVASAMAGEMLAKSAMSASDRVGRRRAAQLSGYPVGMRHEMLSVAMVEGVDELRRRACDWDLVLHLVASHHGYGRPFAPAIIDPSPRLAMHEVEGLPVSADSGRTLAALDSGVPERFWRMVRRYGWFRLAWLEAILRLADHRSSEREQRGEEVSP